MVAVGQDNFDSEVLEAEGLVLVDFWSDGCEPCKALMPDIEELSKKYKNQVKFTTFNVLHGRRLAIKQGVLGLPTVALYKDGEKLDEVITPTVSKSAIEEMIKKHI
ncbi:MAG: thioredoxin [Clostridiales bacterium]|nr:thioredoxin [Clostridiales bacterium]